jgi:hypothetical protein
MTRDPHRSEPTGSGNHKPTTDGEGNRAGNARAEQVVRDAVTRSGSEDRTAVRELAAKPARDRLAQRGDVPSMLIDPADIFSPEGYRSAVVRQAYRVAGIDRELLFGSDGWLVEQVMQDFEVRAQVAVHEARERGHDDSQLVVATDELKAKEATSAAGDENEANILETDHQALPLLLAQKAELEDKLAAADALVLQRQEELISIRETLEVSGAVPPVTAPDPGPPNDRWWNRAPKDTDAARRRRRRREGLTYFELVRLPTPLSVALFLLEIVVATILFSDVLPSVMDLSGLTQTLLIAGAIGAGFQASCLVAGRALAGAEPPVRITSLLLVGLFVAGAAVLLPGLENLREVNDAGVVALTALTALSGLSTLILSYASAVYSAAECKRKLLIEEKNELLEATPSELQGPLQRLAQAIASRDELATKLEKADDRIADIRETIVSKRINAVHAPERVHQLEADRQAAIARLNLDVLRAATYARQEGAYARGTIAAGRIAHETGAVEEMPEESDEPQTLAGVTALVPGHSRTVGTRQRTALLTAAGLLGASAAIGLAAAEPVVYAIGGGLAALAVITGLLSGGDRTPAEPAKPVRPPRVPGQIQASKANSDNDVYVTQPNHYA